MRRFLLLTCLVILIPLTVIALGANTKSSDGVEAELKSLRSQIGSLEKRVKTLETQILADRELKSQQRAVPQRPQTPKGWLRNEFNGIPYYVIPLQTNPKTIKSEKSHNPNPGTDR